MRTLIEGGEEEKKKRKKRRKRRGRQDVGGSQDREVAQSGENLPCKSEDPSSIPALM